MWTSDAAVTDETRPAPREIPPGDSGAGLLAMALQAERRPSVIVPGAPDVTGYEIIRKLGAGSSGEVWLAEEEETGRIVALKILHRHGSTAASVEMLRREIRTLATLVHPNLVLLFGAVATTDGRQGLATEWIDGWPLDEWLELHPDISLDEKLKLFHGMVAGVAHLHDHGVIHRDLKPANLIVDVEGKVKIVDFGLARLHQEGAATGIDGGSVGVSGTLHFMAPEQAANSDGARAMPVDVYALGLILFRILTGRWRYSPDSTPSETLAVVIHPPPLVLSGPARKLPLDLQSILRKTLAREPAMRYRHARDLESDLDRYAAKLPVAARKQTLAYLAATLLRRQAKRSLVAGCLILAGLVAGGTIYQRHRKVAERNEANLRYAYTLTSFTLGQLRDDLLSSVPSGKSGAGTIGRDFPDAESGTAPSLPVTAGGELDLRYYQAQLADLRSATSESHANLKSALDSIQTALNLYSQLAKEAPEDPRRLLDAAQARLSFARLLDRTEGFEAAGIQAQKTLVQLDRLATWPGFDPTSLAPLRCDALQLAAKDAHRTGGHLRAVGLAKEMLAVAEALPSGLLVRAENESAPRLALAAADLATYAVAAGPEHVPDADQGLERATAACRAAHERDADTAAYTRGLALCLLAKARMSLHAGPTDGIQALLGEGATLLTGEGSRLRLSSYPLVREYCATATAWAGAVVDHPDTAVGKAARELAAGLITYLRNNGGATNDIMLLRARLFLYESRLECRSHNREMAARAAARALRLVLSRQKRDPDRLSLALLTAAALHQVRSLAEFPDAGWNEKSHGPLLDALLKQLSERSAELTPEQLRELSALR